MRESETQISFALNFACRLWWPSKVSSAAAIDAGDYNSDPGAYSHIFSQPEYDPEGPIHEADMEHRQCRDRKHRWYWYGWTARISASRARRHHQLSAHGNGQWWDNAGERTR